MGFLGLALVTIIPKLEYLGGLELGMAAIPVWVVATGIGTTSEVGLWRIQAGSKIDRPIKFSKNQNSSMAKGQKFEFGKYHDFNCC